MTRIEPVRAEDAGAVRELLVAAGLPIDDLQGRALEHFLVARDGGRVVGAVGLDFAGEAALLRSLAVRPELRARGLGRELATAAEALAWKRGAKAIYLLTTTAEKFFSRNGYRRAQRSEAPAGIASMPQFAGLCPSSSAFMTKAAPATVIFACVHNAGRSQMAAAFFNALAAPGRARAISAGTQPAERVHPEVMEAMREAGIDLSGARPQKLTEALARDATLLVTMGCGDECPHAPGLRRGDWPLQDPKGQAAGRVREIRDEIRRRVEALLAEEQWNR